jgi:tRNA (adenine57-N1/adenine58-N1)-methyltransferase
MKLLIGESEEILVDEDKLGQDINTHLGILKKSEIAKARFGRKIKTHLDKEFLVIKPCFIDLFKRIKRGPQVITLKDAALIASYTGVSDGYRVLDAGTGSGALACFLGNLVKPSGVVFTYELRERFIRIARENIKMLGLEKLVKLRKGDVYREIRERDLDLITFDLAEPWRALKNCERALRPGGFLVCFLPTIHQVQLLCKKLKKTKLKVFKVCEILERGWVVKERVVRPKSKMIAHTGFLVFARKVNL